MYIWTTTLRSLSLIIPLEKLHIFKKFSDVLDDIQIHNPEMLVYTCFCDHYNHFNYETYRRWKDNYMDMELFKEYIKTSKFKNKLKQDVLELLLDWNHPIYDIIEYEISLM